MEKVSKSKAVDNMFWRLAERFGAQGVNFLVSIVLARILTPEAYGVVALTMTFTTLLAIFTTSGLGTSLIQKKEVDELDYSTALIGNVGIGLILYGLVFIAAPYIARFYHQEKITSILRVLALTLIIGGLNSIQQARISRSMKFKMFFKATLTGTLVSAVVGIGMAVKGLGEWAIVAQYLSNQVIDTACLWVMIGWKPTFRFSWERLKPLYRFGWKAYGAAMIEGLYNSFRSLLIGRYYTSADLAFYNRGCHIPGLINTNTNSAIQSVMFPIYSKSSDDLARMKQMMKKAMSIGTFIIFPCMVGLAIVSKALIEVLYTSKWLSAVPFLQISCFVYALTPMHIVNLQGILAIGRSDISFKVEIVKKTVAAIVVLICIHISLMTTAVSAIPLGIFALIINSYPVWKLLDYPLHEQLKDAAPALVMSVIMGILVYLTGMLPLNSSILILMLQVGVGVSSYCLLARVSHNQDYIFAKEYAYSRLKKLWPSKSFDDNSV